MPAPVKSTRQAASHNAPVLGSWREGRFDFTSPAAREAWHRAAFAQGIDPETWQLGAEVDDKTRHVIAADLAGPMPPFYHGPDGRPRFGNLQTIERPALRDIRARSFGGKSMSAIEAAYAGGKLPGEDEAVGHLLGRKTGPTPSPLALVSAPIPANSNADLLNNKSNERPQLNDRRDISYPQETESGVRDQKSINRPSAGLLLAQADSGTQSNAPPQLPPLTETPQNDAPPTVPDPVFPSGSKTPTYVGEEKSHGKRAKEAEDILRNIQSVKIWPVDGGHRLNERRDKDDQGDGRYGMTRDSGAKVHNGIDIAADMDAPVVAVKDGKVIRVVNSIPTDAGKGANNVGFGNEVIILHDDGTYTQYAHMGPALDGGGNSLKDRDGQNRVVLVEGARVKAGQRIGSVGKTGNVGPGADSHLHFEVRVFNDGVAAKMRETINPFYYLPAP